MRASGAARHNGTHGKQRSGSAMPLESNEFDGAFKKKAPNRAPRRRQAALDEDPDSSVSRLPSHSPCAKKPAHRREIINSACAPAGANKRERERPQEVGMG